MDMSISDWELFRKYEDFCRMHVNPPPFEEWKKRHEEYQKAVNPPAKGSM